jgi:hypothetical protein
MTTENLAIGLIGIFTFADMPVYFNLRMLATVRELKLKSDGDTIMIRTQTIFGSENVVEMAISELVEPNYKNPMLKYVMFFKVADYDILEAEDRLAFMMSKKKGKVLSPELYNKIISR